MTSPGALNIIPKCLPWVFSARTLGSALSQGDFAVAVQQSWSTRSYATQGEEGISETRRVFRRPMRYGSKLAIRDPGRFQRMKAILGYPDDTSPGKVDRVTISTLQTMKYLMSGSENLGLLQGMASYKVTTLNRELLPLLDRTEALLRGK
ncbi:hypothetical protein VaNZ11_004380 [Volvox africanus]|uniref:Uncharacterized protein n=1 Tax=Volvox africanus TaxID=51714 RepID=A0ABQ5RW67_9CHLO|nr:hypothetical protein VaNZ11_004380 [Volvox africanus]